MGEWPTSLGTESLWLCGLNLDLAVRGLNTPLFELSCLRSLALCPCPDIASASSLLLNSYRSTAIWKRKPDHELRVSHNMDVLEH